MRIKLTSLALAGIVLSSCGSDAAKAPTAPENPPMELHKDPPISSSELDAIVEETKARENRGTKAITNAQ